MRKKARHTASLTRRQFIGGVGVAATAALGACAAPGAVPVQPGAGQTLPPTPTTPASAAAGAPAVTTEREVIFWHSYSQPERVAFMEKLVRDFEARNPGVRVSTEVVPWPAFPTKWPAAHAANQLPDVTVLNPEHAVSMWEAGALHSTEDVINQLGGPEAFKPGMLEKTSIWRDEFVAIPHYAHSRLLLQRADWLSELGYPDDFYAKPPTWDEALKAATDMTQPPDRYGWILQLNQADYGGVLVLQQLMRSNGAEFFDADGNVTFDTPESVECVEYLREVYHAAHPPGAVEYRVQDAFNLVNTGRSGFSLETAFVVSVAARDAPEVYQNLRGGYPPQKKSVGWVSEPICISLPKGKNPELGQQLLAMIFEEDYYIPFLHTVPAGMYPSLTAVANSEAFWNNPIIEQLRGEAERTLEGMELGSQVGFDHGPNPYAAILKSGITEEMLQRVFLEDVPPQQAVADTAAKMREQVDDIKRRMNQS